MNDELLIAVIMIVAAAVLLSMGWWLYTYAKRNGPNGNGPPRPPISRGPGKRP